MPEVPPVSLPPAPGPLTIRRIGPDELLRVVIELGGSFMQTPNWAKAKPDWRPEFLGWFDSSGRLVGGASVLYRSIPRTKRSFAYAADGPALPWGEVADDPDRWLAPLVAHTKKAGAFALRIGVPSPVRAWTPVRVKEAMAAGGLLAFTDLTPDRRDAAAERLEAILGQRWTRIGWDTAAAVGQPRFICVLDLAGKDRDGVLKGMNQLWRRNIKKADKAEVEVVDAGLMGLDDFHELYVETAKRDGFVPRTKGYFAAIQQAFGQPGAPVKGRIYEARCEGDVLASALMVTVGTTCSYLYGGSTSRNREARASNALQWRAIQDAIDDGCTAYDFRGFNTSLGATSPLTGLLQFKVGAGAEVIELVGEYELVLNRFWHKAFETAMAARVKINERRFGSHEPTDG